MLSNVIENNEKKPERKICEYKGVTYFVLTDMQGRCFIDVNGERKYLDCNGKVVNKKHGTKSVKTAVENFEDMKKVQDYFIENKQWNFYLLFTLNVIVRSHKNILFNQSKIG